MIKGRVAAFMMVQSFFAVAGCKIKKETRAEGLPVARADKLADGSLDLRGGVGVAVADMNGDSHPDILSVSPGSGVRFFENDGAGAFFDRGVIARDGAFDLRGSAGIAVADIDENGIPDIVIGAPGAGIRIIRNPVPKK